MGVEVEILRLRLRMSGLERRKAESATRTGGLAAATASTSKKPNCGPRCSASAEPIAPNKANLGRGGLGMDYGLRIIDDLQPQRPGAVLAPSVGQPSQPSSTLSPSVSA